MIAFQPQNWGKEHCVPWANILAKPFRSKSLPKVWYLLTGSFFLGKVHKGKGRLREGRKYLVILILKQSLRNLVKVVTYDQARRFRKQTKAIHTWPNDWMLPGPEILFYNEIYTEKKNGWFTMRIWTEGWLSSSDH